MTFAQPPKDPIQRALNGVWWGPIAEQLLDVSGGPLHGPGAEIAGHSLECVRQAGGTLRVVRGQRRTDLFDRVGLLAREGGTVHRAGRLGYCPQRPLLWPKLTVAEHFELFRRWSDTTSSSDPDLRGAPGFAADQARLEALLYEEAALRRKEPRDDLITAVVAAEAEGTLHWGGAESMVGFAKDDLVSFAHVFETTLDCVRSNRLEPNQDVLKVMLRSADVLADLAGTPGRTYTEETELLAFDCFREAPHYHYGPRNKNHRIFWDKTLVPDPLGWTLEQFKSGKLPEMIRRAGYPGVAADYDHGVVSALMPALEKRAREINAQPLPAEPTPNLVPR